MEVNKRAVPEDNYIFNEVIHTGKKLFVTRIGLRIRLTKDHFHWGKLKVCGLGPVRIPGIMPAEWLLVEIVRTPAE